MNQCPPSSETDLLRSRWAMWLLWLGPWVLIVGTSNTGNIRHPIAWTFAFTVGGVSMPGKRAPVRTPALLLYWAALPSGSVRLAALRSADPAVRSARLGLDSRHGGNGELISLLRSGNAARQIQDLARDLTIEELKGERAGPLNPPNEE